MRAVLVLLLCVDLSAFAFRFSLEYPVRPRFLLFLCSNTTTRKTWERVLKFSFNHEIDSLLASCGVVVAGRGAVVYKC